MINYKDFSHYSMFNTLDFNNKIILKGTLEEIYKLPNTNVASLFVSAYRLSKAKDTVRVYLPVEKIPQYNLTKGCYVNIDGQVRTMNKIIDGKSRLIISVKPNTIEKIDKLPQSENENDVTLIGHLVKKPIYRETPLNRQITDFILAVQNNDNIHSSYIPAISWGKNAEFMRDFKEGDKFAIQGRLQSRDYQKPMKDGSIKTLTAFELSARNVVYMRENNLR